VPQRQNGTTINATLSTNPNTGQVIVTLNNPFSVLTNLGRSDSIITVSSKFNDRFNLLSSTNNTINAGVGNDLFSVAGNQTSLNGNILRGGGGSDFVLIGGSGTEIDLTQGSTGIEAVVGRRTTTGESVNLRLDQLAASALTDGGSGRAFAAVIGTDGQVNVQQTGKFQLVGVVDAANNGFAADGSALTGAALTSLLGSVTSIASIQGNLASLYSGSTTGSIPKNETQVSSLTHAYVFSDGSKAYTVWTDATVNITNTKGDVSTVYQPAAATPATAPSYQQVPTFDRNGDWVQASITNTAAGETAVRLGAGSTGAASAFVLTGNVTGTVVSGDSGANGQNFFGLGKSGGNNTVVGSKGGNLFDLQNSLALQDKLIAGKGFDIVRASADGAEVDLTANNGVTSKAAVGIDAVVGSGRLSSIQTVDLDLTKLSFAPNASGQKSAVFTALLGSTDDTLNLFGTGKWVQVAQFAPGTPLPTNASALVGADLLDAAFGNASHKADASLTGYLFEQVNRTGDALRYVTVYTDATIDTSQLPGLSVANTAALLHHDFIL